MATTLGIAPESGKVAMPPFGSLSAPGWESNAGNIDQPALKDSALSCMYIPCPKTAYKQPHPPQSLLSNESRFLSANLDQTSIIGVVPPVFAHTVQRIDLLNILFTGAQGNVDLGRSRWGKIEAVLLIICTLVRYTMNLTQNVSLQPKALEYCAELCNQRLGVLVRDPSPRTTCWFNFKLRQSTDLGTCDRCR